MIAVSGGCACGTVRYTAQIDPAKAYWCHCRMCQRAAGAVAIAFVNTAKIDVAWTAGAVAEWPSSPIALRGFCRNCGTPVCFHYPDSDRMDFTVGSLDDPGVVRPASHFGIESRVPGWIAVDGLPATRCDDHQPLQDRWAGLQGGPE